MNDLTQMLNLMDRPAFCAEDGRITAANAAALARQFSVGESIDNLLYSGQEEYRQFRNGCLYLQLLAGGETYGASVTALDSRHIFTLEPEDTDSELRLLSLTAQTLREPLGNMMALVESLPPDAAPDTQARIERGLYQMLRILGNMTPPPAVRLEMQNLTDFFAELCEKLHPAFEARGVALRCVLPTAAIYSCADSELLTRAVHNLISNSLKYTPAGGTVRLELKRLGRFYQILVHDSGNAPWPMSDPFTRYRREPGIGDGREGLGLGMKLVRLAASAHGGTVLLTAPAEGGLQTALTLPIRQEVPLHSPRLRISYSGERDPMLIELSDVLPPEFYKL